MEDVVAVWKSCYIEIITRRPACIFHFEHGNRRKAHLIKTMTLFQSRLVSRDTCQHAQNQALTQVFSHKEVFLDSVKAKLCLLGTVEHCMTLWTDHNLCAHPFSPSSFLRLVNTEWDLCCLSSIHAVYILCLLLVRPWGGIQPSTFIISDVAQSFLLLMYKWPFRKSIWNHKGFVYTPSDFVWIINN